MDYKKNRQKSLLKKVFFLVEELQADYRLQKIVKPGERAQEGIDSRRLDFAC